MRRDFTKLLALICAHALLYQCQRARNPEGARIATLDDYRAVRELCKDVFEMIVAEGVTPVVLATVQAVKEGEEVSEAELARRLGLSKATANYRVGRALKGGWLVNEELQRGSGHPKCLKRSVPLPEEGSVLPEPKRIAADFEHSNTHSNTPAAPNSLYGRQAARVSVEDFESSNGHQDTERHTPPYSTGTDGRGHTPDGWHPRDRADYLALLELEHHA